ncbi:MAG: M23 family metallopeptidase [Alphaproteobacteria bacterium]|nr:M23 family metallopeptidase [Alphaproteobacteria bacterium]
MKPENRVALGGIVLVSMLVGSNMIASALREPASAVGAIDAARDFIIPVEGVGADRLVSSWGAPRGQGRLHEGIDIMAPAGTPVRATAAGRIVKLYRSKRGGITVYQRDSSGQLVFYYAHLRNYAAGLREGDVVAQGQIIGAVGATGNATTPHLHFEMQRADARQRWWRGAAFNPFVALKSGKIEQRLVRR